MKTYATIGALVTALGVAGNAAALEVEVDFAKDAGALRPALHSSGWGPRSCPRSIQNDDEAVKSMNLTYARTHDWALVNSGQRAVDYQYIFPLFDKDAKDPSNYYFGPTDHLLSLSRDLGLKIFYRLGTSIEHTGDVHFNALVPKDFDKTAEIFASIVRHYNRGWADGKEWDIKYWEIWNEPDGMRNMWCEGNRGNTSDEKQYMEDAKYMRDKFVRFFVTCLKRIKGEFPEVKVGGPALCWFWPEYFEALLQGCKDAGVAPDFISWHYYGADPDALLATTETARKLCDKFGFSKTELVINEYHYLLSWDGIHGKNSTPAMVKRALDGPTGHCNIDAACFYLTMLSRFQASPLDQAYWYGCSHQGNWGYMDQYKQFNKTYYAAKMFGGILKDFPRLGEVKKEGTVTTFVAKSADGKETALLVTDYRGTDQVLRIRAKGLGKVKDVSATVLDDTRDEFPCEAGWRNGTLTLVKPDKNSAAFLVRFAH